MRSGTCWRLLPGPLDGSEPFLRVVAAAIVNSRNVKATETGYDTGKQIEDRKRHMAMDTEGLPIVLQVHKHRERAPDVSGLFAAGGRAGTRLRG